MKTSIKKLIKSGERISRCCVLLFLFIIFSASNLGAMQDSSAVAQPDSGIAAQDNGGPSLQNMKKMGSAMTEEIKKMKEKQAREEMLSYVYMVLGFGLVFAGAWFLTVQSRKRREKFDERKRQFLQNKVANQGGKTAHRDSHRRGHKRH